MVLHTWQPSTRSAPEASALELHRNLPTDARHSRDRQPSRLAAVHQSCRRAQEAMPR
eukprot:CAMPEP_0171110968 /NCGR_PEP_ID=MMETSP0766_2-20121228/73184_1 /TAXON_ID=439317 /ORGANISM="Gambierdiscus australes, Strain CAWD 149" /LENGTH=56 /DNA_ID=CAMNT_0011572899 /DNA_START=137 /DNA_END=303 /DNA_ORIENTATION=-